MCITIKLAIASCSCTTALLITASNMGINKTVAADVALDRRSCLSCESKLLSLFQAQPCYATRLNSALVCARWLICKTGRRIASGVPTADSVLASRAQGPIATATCAKWRRDYVNLTWVACSGEGGILALGNVSENTLAEQASRCTACPHSRNTVRPVR